MQIGVTVKDFVDINGFLFYQLTVKFNHPKVGVRGEISGTIPFNSTQQDALREIKAWITESYGITVPNNAQIKTIGI